MPSTHHTAMGLSSPSSAIILVALVLMSFLYVCGWRRVRRASRKRHSRLARGEFPFRNVFSLGSARLATRCLRS